MSDLNFLQGYLELNSGTEIPKPFALWSGVSGISAALGRSVWIDMGTYTIFPNFFVVLIAPSGQFRKSTGAKLIQRMLLEMRDQVNLIPEKVTPEGLIDCLGMGQDAQPGNWKPNKECVGFVFADELNFFLNRRTYDAGLNSILIKLFDCNELVDTYTRVRGSRTLTNSCLGLLGASTADWLRSAIPEDAIGGGLTSRMIFVYTEELPPPVPWTTFSDKKKKLFETLTNSLRRIATLEGPITLTQDARDFYEKKYIDFYYDKKLFSDKNLAGYASRRGVHLLKLSIVVAVSESPSLTIDAHHIKHALQLLEIAESYMSRVLRLIATAPIGEMTEFVYNVIDRRHKVRYAELLSLTSHKLSATELLDILKTLQDSERVHREDSQTTTWFHTGSSKSPSPTPKK
jgi:hypothetical protein